MTKSGSDRLIEHLDRLFAEPDDRLLTEFLATKDEESFAALVRRHGPMVFGVCRRLLRHQQDAEDCFQATFLILARRASTVVRRASLASWLYGTAYRTALAARSLITRRRIREKQVDDMPHPSREAEEPQDWWPLLDRELNRLPEKYRTPVVLCDLEGRPRKDAASLLGIPEGTLSSRLATARDMLAKRLAGKGFAVLGSLTTVFLSETAAASVPSPLVVSTSKAAALVVVGKLAADATRASVLTSEVLNAMFMTKLKAAVAVLLIAVALGVTGVASRVANESHAQAPPTESKVNAKTPVNELEALRRENELLKLNLRVTLEKLEAQEVELKSLRGKAGPKPLAYPPMEGVGGAPAVLPLTAPGRALPPPAFAPSTDPTSRELEAAVKALRDAKDETSRQRAIKALDEAVRKLRPSPVPESAPPLGTTGR